MSYIALYRRYRPDTFDDVSGQDTIVKILKTQVKKQQIAHAYIFSGIRGTGKTSVAKIFARAVNCENDQDGNPCNCCETCKAINNEQNIDIIEIDGASNRGVDEIRDIRDKVKYPPSIGKYKVYIIDEVHMLTKEAFNALLKTLEEPPEHVIFVLATTEIYKIPDTIKSRCQKYNFKRISRKIIIERMKKILNENELTTEEKGLQLIALRSEGSMRDALSILDQCIALQDDHGHISYSVIREYLGLTENEIIIRLINSIELQDDKKLSAALEEVSQSGNEPEMVIEQMIELYYQRQLYIMDSEAFDREQLRFEGFNKTALSLSKTQILKRMEMLIEVKTKLKTISLPYIYLEVKLMQMALPSGESVSEVSSQAVEIKKKIEKPSAEKTPDKLNSEIAKQGVKKESEKIDEGIKPLADKKITAEDFRKLQNRLFESIADLGQFYQTCIKKSALSIDGSTLYISFSKNDVAFAERLKDKKSIEFLEEWLNKNTKKLKYVNITTDYPNQEEIDIVEATQIITGLDNIEVIE
jgi:DNA polymerase-3 subunit gamma/tau